jgi:hypothetical protein
MTKTSNDDDLSITTLVQDVVDVLERILPPVDPSADPNDTPQTIIAGHRYAHHNELKCTGVAVDSYSQVLSVQFGWSGRCPRCRDRDSGLARGRHGH